MVFALKDKLNRRTNQIVFHDKGISTQDADKSNHFYTYFFLFDFSFKMFKESSTHSSTHGVLKS